MFGIERKVCVLVLEGEIIFGGDDVCVEIVVVGVDKGDCVVFVVGDGKVNCVWGLEGGRVMGDEFGCGFGGWE